MSAQVIKGSMLSDPMPGDSTPSKSTRNVTGSSQRTLNKKTAVLSAYSGAMEVFSPVLLPALLFAEALFLGTTYRTVATVIPITLVAVILAYVIKLSRQRKRESHADLTIKASKDAQRDTNIRSQSTFQTAQTPGWLRLLRVVGLLMAVVVISAWRIGYHIRGNLNPMAMAIDAIAHSLLVISVLLWVFYPRRGHPAMLACGIFLVMACITAGGVSHTITGQLVAALATLVGFTLASRQILGICQNEKAISKSRRRKKRKSLAGKVAALDDSPLPMSTVTYEVETSHTGLVLSILTLSALLMLSSVAGQVASVVVPGFRTDLFEKLSQSLESVTGGGIIGGSRYVSGSRLGTIRQHMLGDPQETAVRAYASLEPGYLRGTVFDRYRLNGSWMEVRPNSRSLSATYQERQSLNPRSVEMSPGQEVLQGEGVGELERLQILPENGVPLKGTIEVHNVPMKGKKVFTALSTQWIEASVYGLYGPRVSHHNVIKDGVIFAQPYILGISTENPKEELGGARRRIMLSLPSEIDSEIKAITKRVCDGRLTPRSKATAIEDFFAENFQYSMKPFTPPSDVDPVIHFLQAKHPAHCEYFASAAALMLRSVGVPTRYVTGYVVQELSDEYDYWLARNRDAHAWVEAYDDISGEWFPVEATVGRTYGILRTEAERIAEDNQVADGFDENSLEDSILQRTVALLTNFRAADSLSLVFRLAQAPLFLILVVLLYLRHRRRIRDSMDPLESKCREMLQAVDRRLRKHNLVRQPSETLHQFASRVEDSALGDQDGADFLRRAASWYRSFAASRYRGQLPQAMSDI